jgi:hypothetical protein
LLSSLLIKQSKSFFQQIKRKNIDPNDTSVSTLDITYEQIDLTNEIDDSVKVEPEEKPPIEFYGEPVPDDDDDDDALFEMAAGLPKRKRDTEKTIEEEPPPDDEIIQLDYCAFLKRIQM